MDTDLEVVIRDPSLLLTPAHIKAYVLMTLQGLEYLHSYGEVLGSLGHCTNCVNC